MKMPHVIPCAVWFFALYVVYAEDTANETGAISGRILPKDASVRIIAKLAGTEYRIKENIKGEVTLTKGGDFIIKGLLPGKYDLLFFLQGETNRKYMAARWSEVDVKEGKTTSGINYRLTPQGSEQLIDEVVVAFEGVNAADAQQIIHDAGCIVKDSPLNLGATTIYTVDIPDEKNVPEMIRLFKQKKGVKYAEPNGIATIDAK